MRQGSPIEVVERRNAWNPDKCEAGVEDETESGSKTCEGVDGNSDQQTCNGHERDDKELYKGSELRPQTAVDEPLTKRKVHGRV